MHILAIDTVTEMCSVALEIEDKVFSRQSMAPNQHSNIILGMVDSVLKEAQVSVSKLDLIICDVGPGSFTGIRIGMGVAQGLAYGAEAPLLGLDALSILAQGVKDQQTPHVFSAIDARMQQVYWALFSRQKNELILEGQLHLSRPQDIPKLSVPVIGAGSGWTEYAEILQGQIDAVHNDTEPYPLAVSALELGRKLPKSEWVNAGALLPVYLRNDVAKVSQKKLKP